MLLCAGRWQWRRVRTGHSREYLVAADSGDRYLVLGDRVRCHGNQPMASQRGENAKLQLQRHWRTSLPLETHRQWTMDPVLHKP